MGQRIRQRARRRRGRDPEQIDWTTLRGSAAKILETLGDQGTASELFARWASASLSDLVMLRKAIRESWPVPNDVRGALAAAVMSKMRSEPRYEKMTTAVARTFLAMEQANIAAESAARQAGRV
jgi:hypothetical protein